MQIDKVISVAMLGFFAVAAAGGILQWKEAKEKKGRQP